MNTFEKIMLFLEWRIKLAINGKRVKNYWIVSDYKEETNYMSDIDYDRADNLIALFNITKNIEQSKTRKVIGFEADCYA